MIIVLVILILFYYIGMNLIFDYIYYDDIDEYDIKLNDDFDDIEYDSEDIIY